MEKENNRSDTITKSLFWKVFERLSVQGINLIVQIVLARILLPTDFGNLAIIVAVTNYAGIFVQTGFATAIIQKKEIEKKDISTLLTTSLVVAVFFYVLLFFLAPFISNIYSTNELIWPLRVLGLLLFLNAINSIQTAVLSKKMMFRKIFYRSIIAVPISGVVGILLALNGFGLWALVIHNVLNAFIIVVVMSFDKDCRFIPSFSFRRLKHFLPFSTKILLTGCVTGGGDFIRTLLIGSKYSTEELSYYDKAYTYSNYATQIAGQSITSVMLPSLSREQDNSEIMKNLARKSIQMSTFVMFPVLLGIAAVSEPFVLIFLTDKWAPAIPFLMIFCVLRMPSFICNIDKQVFYALGKSGIILVYEIILLALNVSVLFFTLQFGVIYIAVGAMAVEWIGCFSICIVSKYIYKYSLVERLCDVWKPTLNSLIMFICVYLLKYLHLNLFLTFFIQVLCGISLFFLLSFITRDKSLKELFSRISALFKKNKVIDTDK